MACRKVLLNALALLCFSYPAFAETTIETFDEAQQLPATWKTGVTGKGTAEWTVVPDPTAPSKPNALKQSGEATFCWAARTDQSIKDGYAQVQFKPVSGREDQAAGLVFRFKDGNNYYVVRANALEGNVVLYKTVEGRRSSLQVKGRLFGYGVDVEVPKASWSTLRVEFAGPLFVVFLNGKRLFEVEDSTFSDAGAVGLWTKADSVTLFDNFQYGRSGQNRPARFTARLASSAATGAASVMWATGGGQSRSSGGGRPRKEHHSARS